MGLSLVVILCGAPFALGCALAIRRLKWHVWSGLFFGEPLAAIFAYEIINPDPGCTGDCPGKLFTGFAIVFVTVGWWAGLMTGLWVGWPKGPPPN